MPEHYSLPRENVKPEKPKSELDAINKYFTDINPELKQKAQEERAAKEAEERANAEKDFGSSISNAIPGMPGIPPSPFKNKNGKPPAFAIWFGKSGKF